MLSVGEARIRPTVHAVFVFHDYDHDHDHVDSVQGQQQLLCLTRR